MERQYTRLDEARNIIDPIIKGITDEESKRGAYVHLYGVGLMALLIALKRGYSREIAELAEIAGMLHDLLTYVDRAEDTDDHAYKCADYAQEYVLSKLKSFTEEELKMIYNGIYHHSDKRNKGHWFDEIIKDADCAQHALRNPLEEYFYQMPRVQQVLNELIYKQNHGGENGNMVKIYGMPSCLYCDYVHEQIKGREDAFTYEERKCSNQRMGNDNSYNVWGK